MAADEVMLAYVAALQNASDRAATRCTRYFTLRMLTSLVLLAIVFGAVSSTEKTELLGATLRLAPWTFLVVGSIFVSLLLLLEFAQYERAHLLALNVVRAYYCHFGLKEPLHAWREGSSPWGLELVAAAPSDPGLPRGLTDRHILVLLTALSFFLTLGAEFLVWRELLRDSTGGWWPWLFGLIPVSTLVLALRRYSGVARQVRAGEKPHLAVGEQRRATRVDCDGERRGSSADDVSPLAS